MKCSTRFRRSKRYINPPSRRSDVSPKDAIKMIGFERQQQAKTLQEVKSPESLEESRKTTIFEVNPRHDKNPVRLPWDHLGISESNLQRFRIC